MLKNPSSVLLFDLYAPMLSDRQREIFDHYYNCDLSLGEIAENFGITRQAVLNSIRKSESRLSDIDNKLGFSEYMLTSSAAVERIKKSALEVLQGNDVENNVQTILSSADEISDYYS